MKSYAFNIAYSTPYHEHINDMLYFSLHWTTVAFSIKRRMKWTIWLLDACEAKSRFKASWSDEAICSDEAQCSYLRAVLWLSNTAHYCLYIRYCMFTVCDYPSTAAKVHHWCPDGSDSDVHCLTCAGWLSYAMCENDGLLILPFPQGKRWYLDILTFSSTTNNDTIYTEHNGSKMV